MGRIAVLCRPLWALGPARGPGLSCARDQRAFDVDRRSQNPCWEVFIYLKIPVYCIYGIYCVSHEKVTELGAQTLGFR
jgi:hypothetical protein